MGKHFIRLTVLVKFYEISTTFFMPADTVLVRLFYFIFFLFVCLSNLSLQLEWLRAREIYARRTRTRQTR